MEPRSAWDVDPLQTVLNERYRIEVPIMSWHSPPRRMLRISAQAYKTLEDYRALVEALRIEL